MMNVSRYASHRECVSTGCPAAESNQKTALNSIEQCFGCLLSWKETPKKGRWNCSNDFVHIKGSFWRQLEVGGHVRSLINISGSKIFDLVFVLFCFFSSNCDKGSIRRKTRETYDLVKGENHFKNKSHCCLKMKPFEALKSVAKPKIENENEKSFFPFFFPLFLFWLHNMNLSASTSFGSQSKMVATFWVKVSHGKKSSSNSVSICSSSASEFLLGILRLSKKLVDRNSPLLSICQQLIGNIVCVSWCCKRKMPTREAKKKKNLLTGCQFFLRIQRIQLSENVSEGWS